MQSIFAGRALRNRGGAVIAAVGIAVLATILLVVYLHSYRSSVNSGKEPLLDAFDCPDPSTATPKRGATTTPLQALSLLNNSFTLRMADDLAARIAKDVGEDKSKQVARAIELAYGRSASESEIAASLPLVEKHGLAPFCRVLLNTNGVLYVH